MGTYKSMHVWVLPYGAYMSMYAHIWAYMSIYAHICAYIRIYEHICAYMSIYAHIWAYMRIYATLWHFCGRGRWRQPAWNHNWLWLWLKPIRDSTKSQFIKGGMGVPPINQVFPIWESWFFLIYLVWDLKNRIGHGQIIQKNLGEISVA